MDWPISASYNLKMSINQNFKANRTKLVRYIKLSFNKTNFSTRILHVYLLKHQLSMLLKPSFRLFHQNVR